MVCPVSHSGDLPSGTRGHRPERDRFRVRDSHPLRWAVPGGLPLTITFLSLRRGSSDPLSSLTTPAPQRLTPITWIGFELFPFRSPLLREGFLFLEVLRCFSSLGALRAPYVFRCGSSGLVPTGFPHSEISGSPFATNSPELFAGNRVLHRPQAPRHSPCALCSLTYSSIQPGPRTGRTGAADSPIRRSVRFRFWRNSHFVFLFTC